MPDISQWPLSPEGIRFIVPEFIVAELATNPLTDGCYLVALGYYPNAFGHRMDRPIHSDQLIIYCTDGEGLIQVGNDSQLIKRGDMLVLPKNIAHRYQATTNSPWTIYWVHFDGLLSNHFLAPLVPDGQAFSVLPLGIQPKLVADFEALLEVRRTGYNPRNFVYASNQLRQILSFLGASGHLANNQAEQLNLDAIHAMMQENLHGQLSLDTLAKKVQLSKYHFSSKYKSITGQSPIQHFLHLKMEHACYLLDISGNSVKEISRSLGYEDNFYFSRLFKKIIGVSPRQYRQLKRG
ncbi:AraC family transcriptional regulator [Oceanicoccus sp. KOV_DT_Chl]|uniref:AraC family transcriptional regulator n=1 Tax=Oceanicoccus sp. KOV_DT_Chl TaxID=1904639 RepID=UPI000C7CC3AF|nr:AraC family transcriptional regulator [Oceanicoccus sp. KOV_DT_Chl]